MIAVDLKTLLSRGPNTAEVELPGLGSVTVRGLSRYEVSLATQATGEGRAAAIEKGLLFFGLVEPKVTEDQVDELLKVLTFGEVNLLVSKINELSGFGAGADKS